MVEGVVGNERSLGNVDRASFLPDLATAPKKRWLAVEGEAVGASNLAKGTAGRGDCEREYQVAQLGREAKDGWRLFGRDW